MPTRQTWPIRISGLLLVAFGILTVVSRDFAFQWQPVPPTVPGRELFAMVAGVLEIVIGGAMWRSRWQHQAAVAGSAVFFGWMALHIPAIVRSPLDVAAWLGGAETAALALGLWIASCRKSPAPAFVRAYGVTLLVFGVSHFVYAQFTAAMIPQWLPARLFLAYLTGALHLATGIALLLRFRTRLTAILEGCMMFSFVALVHIPRVAATPASRMEWTMLLVACALSCSALQVAQSE